MMEYETYLDEATLPFPFCPGCGHGAILEHLNTALVKLQLDPRRVVIVTDIGCSGLGDKFFTTNAFHGLHGRSLTYATGVKLANPDLKVIVLVGDGGCGIGGNHLIHAARRNIGVTVLVFNNLNFGMTGGEHSVTTPPGAITATTRYGHLEQPLDICRTLAVNGAGFAARTTAYDKELPDLIAQALSQDGFALVDIWELCTAYYVPNNAFNRKQLEATMQELGFGTGIVHHQERPEYSQAYRQAVAGEAGKARWTGRPLPQKFKSDLNRAAKIVIAGAAGMKIVTAATCLCQGAILSGLWATQRSDYAVTVKAGHSLSEVVLSPEEILFTAVARPDILVVLSAEGLKKVTPALANMGPEDLVYIYEKLLPVETHARVLPLALHKAGRRPTWAMSALAEVLRHTRLYPLAGLEEAIRLQEDFADEYLKAVSQGEGMLANSVE